MYTMCGPCPPPPPPICDRASLKKKVDEVTTALNELASSQIAVEKCRFAVKGIFEHGIVKKKQHPLCGDNQKNQYGALSVPHGSMVHKCLVSGMT